MKHEDIEQLREDLRRAEYAETSRACAVAYSRCTQRVEALLDELAALRERGRWRPIEEAPHVHNQRIIGGTPGGYVHVWEYDEQRFHKNPRPFWSRPFHGVGYDRANQPTHWLPLPEAPR